LRQLRRRLHRDGNPVVARRERDGARGRRIGDGVLVAARGDRARGRRCFVGRERAAAVGGVDRQAHAGARRLGDEADARQRERLSQRERHGKERRARERALAAPVGRKARDLLADRARVRAHALF